MRDRIFYHIYPLGLCGCPNVNEGDKTKGNRILTLLDWIPHLKDLGVNGIYLGPIWESVTHGYDTTDYYNLDSRLGTNDDLKVVIDAFHDAEMLVILDGVFNHVGRKHKAVVDVLSNREGSEYKDWIAGLNFSSNNYYNDGLCYDCWSGAQELVKLNLYNENVNNYLLKAIEMWIDEFDIDGLRLDAADCIQKDFFKRLRAFTKEKKSDFWLMGEIIHGDYTQYANNDMLDSVTNYECWKGIYSSHNDHNYFEINYAMKRQWGVGGIYQGIYLYNFVDNHDVNRIATLINEADNIYPVYTLLFTMPGIPSIYYGSEWAIEGDKTKGMGDYALRMPIDISKMPKDTDLIDHIRILANVRKSSNAIKYGHYEEVQVKNETLVFARVYNDEFAIIALNNTKEPKELNFSFQGKDYYVKLPEYGSKIWNG